MSSRAGDELHWDLTRGNAILPPPPRNERRQEISHVDQPIRSPDRSGASHPAGGCPRARPRREAVLGGFTLLMLAAAWITFLRSEANT